MSVVLHTDLLVISAHKLSPNLTTEENKCILSQQFMWLCNSIQLSWVVVPRGFPGGGTCGFVVLLGLQPYQGSTRKMRASSLTGHFPYGPLLTFPRIKWSKRKTEKQRDRERSKPQASLSFSNLILEMASHHFCHIVLIRK